MTDGKKTKTKARQQAEKICDYFQAKPIAVKKGGAFFIGDKFVGSCRRATTNGRPKAMAMAPRKYYLRRQVPTKYGGTRSLHGSMYSAALKDGKYILADAGMGLSKYTKPKKRIRPRLDYMPMDPNVIVSP